MGQFFVREYCEDDEDELIAIHDLARPVELQGSCDPRAFVPLRNDAKDFNEFRACRKLVAFDHGRIHGFVGIGNLEIGWLYVRPDSSRQGIGRRLLSRAMALIQKDNVSGTAVSVFVLEANKPAITLYESKGFRITETFKSKNNGYPCNVHKMLSDYNLNCEITE